MSQKINRHLRREVVALHEKLREKDATISRLRRRILLMEDEADERESAHEAAEARCERSRRELRHEVETERQAREDLEWEADQARRATKRSLF